jgi:hypothetical protein
VNQSQTIDFNHSQDSDLMNKIQLQSTTKKSAHFNDTIANSSVKNQNKRASSYSRMSDQYIKEGGFFATPNDQNLVVENERLKTSVVILNNNLKMVQEDFS